MKGTDICLISVAFREGATCLSDFLLRSSIMLTSEGTSLSSGCRGEKSSGGCRSMYLRSQNFLSGEQIGTHLPVQWAG